MHFYSPGLTFTFGSLSLSAPEVYVESYWRNPCIEYGRQKNENGKLKMLLWREDMLGRSEWVTCLSIFDLFLVSLRVGINNRNRRKSKHQGIQLRTWNFLFLVECSRKTWNFLFLSRNNNKQSLGSVFFAFSKSETLFQCQTRSYRKMCFLETDLLWLPPLSQACKKAWKKWRKKRLCFLFILSVLKSMSRQSCVDSSVSVEQTKGH